MLTLPPLPAWDALHPLVVHFPIALLLIAPLFIVIGAVSKPERGFPLLLSALILMVLGTASTFVAAASGHAAGELLEAMPQAKTTLEQHEDLAQITQIVFSALTLIFAAILFVPRLLHQEPTRVVAIVLPTVFLVFYATGAILLANTAHQGGRLAHELEVKQPVQNVALDSLEHK